MIDTGNPEAVQRHCEELAQALRASGAAKSAAEAKSRELADSAAAADANMAKLEKQNADLERDLAIEKGNAADGASQLAVAKAMQVELEKRCADLKKTLQTQTSKASKDASAATAALEESNAARAAADAKLSELQKQHADLQSDLASRNTQLGDSASALEAAKASAASEVAVFKARLAELQKQHEDLTSDLSAQKNKADADARTAASALEVSDAAKTAAESKVIDLEGRLTDMESRYMEVIDARVAQLERDRANRAALRAAKTSVAALEAKLSESQRRYAALESDLSLKSSTASEALKASDAAKIAAESKVAELEEHRVGLEVSLAAERGKVASGVEALEAAKRSAASDVAGLESKLAELQRQCLDLKSDLSSQQAKADKDALTAASALEASEAAKEQRGRELEGARAKQLSAEKAAEDLREAAEAASKTSADAKAAAEAQVEAFTKQKSELEAKLATEKSKVAEAEEATKTSNVAKAAAEAKVAELKDQNGKLEADKRFADGLVAAAKEMSAFAQTKLVAVEADLATSNVAKAAAEAKVAELQKQKGQLEIEKRRDDAAKKLARDTELQQQKDEAAKAVGVGLLYDERMLCHRNLIPFKDGEEHPEKPSRIKSIWGHLKEEGLVPRCKRVDCRAATSDELRLRHSSAHVRAMSQTRHLSDEDAAKQGNEYDSFFLCPQSFDAGCLAAGSVIEAVEHVCSRKLQSAVCVVRPPGHHAECNRPMGFCMFNNVALAAARARSMGWAERILIVDWDVHHGNGTQRMFEEDRSVLYFSIHRYDGARFYPNSLNNPFGHYTSHGKGDGCGFSVNVPWEVRDAPKGIRPPGDAEYISTFERVLRPIAADFDPDLVIVSAGFDCAEGDHLGGCRVSPAGFHKMTEMVKGLAGGRLVLALEGGYNLESMSKSMAACVRALLGDSVPQEVDSEQPHHFFTKTINDVIRHMSTFWPSMKKAVDDLDQDPRLSPTVPPPPLPHPAPRAIPAPVQVSTPGSPPKRRRSQVSDSRGSLPGGAKTSSSSKDLQEESFGFSGPTPKEDQVCPKLRRR